MRSGPSSASSWTAKRRFRETLSGHELFGDELLDFQYFLIDVHRYSEDELSQLSNLIGSIFLLDQMEDGSELIQKLRKLTALLQHLSDEQLHLFSTWIQRIYRWHLPLEAQKAVDELSTSMKMKEGVNEMLTNFERVLDEWIEQKLAEGEDKGLQKGFERGIERGIARGKDEGRAEGLEQVAKEMLASNMPLEQIMRFTKLSREKEKLEL